MRTFLKVSFVSINISVIHEDFVQLLMFNRCRNMFFFLQVTISNERGVNDITLRIILYRKI